MSSYTFIFIIYPLFRKAPVNRLARQIVLKGVIYQHPKSIFCFYSDHDSAPSDKPNKPKNENSKKVESDTVEKKSKELASSKDKDQNAKVDTSAAKVTAKAKKQVTGPASSSSSSESEGVLPYSTVPSDAAKNKARPKLPGPASSSDG